MDMEQSASESTALEPFPNGVQSLSVEIARDILRKAKRVDEAREVADKAKAIGIYLRGRDAAIEAQFDALEIQLRAERRIGELMGTSTSASFGMKNTLRYRCRDLARIPDDLFDKLVAELRSTGEMFTPNALLGAWKLHEEADDLGEKAAPKLVEAVRAGKIDGYVAKDLVGKPRWKQDELAADPDAAYDAYLKGREKVSKSRDEDDPSDAVAAFIREAKSFAADSQYLVDLKVIPPTLHRQLVKSIDEVTKRAKAHRR